MQLRCPKCQSALKEGSQIHLCPNCNADLTKLLTPIETGIMTDGGLALLGGVTGLLFAIVLLVHVKEFRSLILIAIVVLGSSLSAWAKVKSLKAKERLAWERFWIIAFFASVGAFWTVLMGLSWIWAFVIAFLSGCVGYFLCRHSEKQWQKERMR
ncbi:MAG: zf-TFIIB domain-containing protein [Armatimonadetes bacterium]|nr:zf-TFIIB domain-containing protein [Armatimonadota bacterium]MDW8028857.1 zf-TFIIB domain-containing protein [Armatimonadota bacterium]